MARLKRLINSLCFGPLKRRLIRHLLEMIRKRKLSGFVFDFRPLTPAALNSNPKLTAYAYSPYFYLEIYFVVKFVRKEKNK